VDRSALGGLRRVTILNDGGLKRFPTDGVIRYALLGHHAVEIASDRGVLRLPEPPWPPAITGSGAS
jgi:hypothetical protein